MGRKTEINLNKKEEQECLDIVKEWEEKQK